MLKLLFLSLFSFVILLCIGQQTLFLEIMGNGKIKTIKLPCVVRVTFKNGVDKKLLLQKLSGDSFYFKNTITCLKFTIVQ
jgi:hypothetical protein